MQHPPPIATHWLGTCLCNESTPRLRDVRRSYAAVGNAERPVRYRMEDDKCWCDQSHSATHDKTSAAAYPENQKNVQNTHKGRMGVSRGLRAKCGDRC